MATVALLVNPARADATALAQETVAWLGRSGHAARLFHLAPAERAEHRVPAGELSGADLSGADLAVSLGGDGTFLRLVPLAYASGVPVLGVNFGRVGYLLGVQPSELNSAIAGALDGETAVEERIVLAVTVSGDLSPAAGDDRSLPGDGSVCSPEHRWWVALNEMVVEKTVPGHMVSLSTAVDGEELLSYNADGVLIASPTGSTAYNLSAGGPILAPDLPAMVLTPVAPHLAIGRSLVLRADEVATIRVLPSRPAVLVVDGREAGRLSAGSQVTCRVAPGRLRVVSAGDRGFAGPLRRAMTLGRQP